MITSQYLKLLNIERKHILVYLYIISLPFQVNINYFIPIDIIFLNKLFLSEFIFIIFVFATFKFKIFSDIKYYFDIFDILVLTWGISYLLSFFFGSKYYHSYVDALGNTYLIILYFYVKYTFDKKDVLFLIGGIMASALICSIIGIIGYNFAFFQGIKNITTYYESNYPYIGELYRIRSFMLSPSMMTNFLIIGSVLCVYTFRFNRKYIYIIAFYIISLCFLLSFTKNIICLFCSLFLVLTLQSKFTLKIKLNACILLTVVMAIIYVASSHFIVSTSNITYDSENIFVVVENYYNLKFLDRSIYIYPTSYFYNKIAAMSAFHSSPLFGIGPGNYNQYITELKEVGLHPLNFPNWDPHSTYFGVLAENGIFGLISLVGIFSLIIYKLLKHYPSQNTYNYALASIIVGLLIDGISLDIMKFRHLWVLIAIISISCKISGEDQNTHNA